MEDLPNLFRKSLTGRLTLSIGFRIGAVARECMEVAGANIHFYVCSSPAHEFYGHQRDLSIKHAHLDLAIIEVLDATALSGCNMFWESSFTHYISDRT